MAALGATLLDNVLGHSKAEQAFRPWWDSFEDFLVYGLVMLGEKSEIMKFCEICTSATTVKIEFFQPERNSFFLGYFINNEKRLSKNKTKSFSVLLEYKHLTKTSDIEASPEIQSGS